MKRLIVTTAVLSLLMIVPPSYADEDCEVAPRCVACGDAGPINLLPDGSFETGLGGWVLVRGNGETILEVDAPQGEYVARLGGSWAKLESPAIRYEPGMMFTVSAWLRTQDTRGRVDLWLLAYSDDAGTQFVDEIPLSRYNIVDERRIAVLESDTDWHSYAARNLRLTPVARSFRLALRHRGLDADGINQTYLDNVQVRRGLLDRSQSGRRDGRSRCSCPAIPATRHGVQRQLREVDSRRLSTGRIRERCCTGSKRGPRNPSRAGSSSRAFYGPLSERR